MIDHNNETLLSVSAATNAIPGRPTRLDHLAVDQARLPWCPSGDAPGRRGSVFTSKEAIDRFVRATSHADSPAEGVVASSTKASQANDELDSLGL